MIAASRRRLPVTIATRSLNLPTLTGRTEPFTPRPAPAFPPAQEVAATRIAFAAAHVVPYPLAAIDPPLDVAIDWDATLAFRHHLWSLGFRVAEAMDTAQRGMGLDWSTTQELIRRSV